MNLLPIFSLILTVIVGFIQSSSLNTPLHTQNDNSHAVKNPAQVLLPLDNGKPQLPLNNAEQVLTPRNNAKQALAPPIHCIDENNNVVDWVILVKLPRTHGSPNPLIVNGEAYLTVSSEDVKQFEQRQQNQGRQNQDRQNESGQNQAKTFEQRKTSTNNNKNGKNIAEKSHEKTTAHNGHNEKRKKKNHARKNPQTNDGSIRQNNVKNKHGKNNVGSGHVEMTNRKNKKSQKKSKHSHVHGKRQNSLNHRQDKEGQKHSGERKLSTPLIPNPLISQLDAFEADLKEHQIEHMKKVGHINNTRLPESENSILNSNNGQNLSSWFETSLFNALKQKVNDNSLEEKDIQLLFHDEDKSERRNVKRRDVNNALDTVVERKLDQWNVENSAQQTTIPVSEFVSLMKSADEKPALVSQRARVSFNDNIDLTEDDDQHVGHIAEDDLQKHHFVGLDHITGPPIEVARREWSAIWEAFLMMKRNRALKVLDDMEYVVHAHNMLHGQSSALDDEEKEELEPSKEYPKSSQEYPKPSKESVESESKSAEEASLEEDFIMEKNNEFKEAKDASKDSLLQWTLSKHSIRDASSLPGRLLSPYLFNSSFTPLFTQDGVKILYNDQTPGNKTTVSFGHSKGLLVGNSQGGIWIVHSVPHFVDDSVAEYSYPHTGLMYGQNFLCLTLNASTLDSVGSNLGVNQIYKYSTFMSESVRSLYPTLSKVIDGSFAPPEQNFILNDFSTSFATQEAFHSFAKTKELGQDLYQVVGDQLGVSLLVETWPNGPGRLRSDCKNPAGHFVENVASIGDAGVVSYRSTHDHAKWAISFGNDTSRMRKSAPPGFGQEARLLRRSGKSQDFGHATKTKVTRKPEELGHKNQTHTQKDSNEEALYSKANQLDGSFESVFKRIEDLATLDSDDNNWRVNVNKNNVELNNVEKKEDNGNVELRTDGDSVDSECAYAKHGGINLEEVDWRNTLVEDKDNVELEGTDHKSTYDDRAVAMRDTVEDSANDVSTTSSNYESIEEEGTEVERVDYWVCNGDINRAEDQLKRGGGTVCMNNKAVWTLYQGLINGVEPCPAH